MKVAEWKEPRPRKPKRGSVVVAPLAADTIAVQLASGDVRHVDRRLGTLIESDGGL